MTPAVDPLDADPGGSSRLLPAQPLVPLLLLLLAIGDLRVDLLLLFDHFTVTSLLEAIRSHPLAVVVLVSQPSLWRRYRRQRVVTRPAGTRS